MIHVRGRVRFTDLEKAAVTACVHVRFASQLLTVFTTRQLAPVRTPLGLACVARCALTSEPSCGLRCQVRDPHIPSRCRFRRRRTRRTRRRTLRRRCTCRHRCTRRRRSTRRRRFQPRVRRTLRRRLTVQGSSNLPAGSRH